MQNRIYCSIKYQPLGVQRSIRLFWNKWKWQNRIVIVRFNFLRNKNYVHKISSRNGALYKFHNKFFLESFVSIYHLYHLFGIICKSIFYYFNYWFISKTISVKGNFIWNCPSQRIMVSLFWHTIPWYPFPFCSVIDDIIKWGNCEAMNSSHHVKIIIMFQNAQTHFKYLAAFAARFLKCVWPFEQTFWFFCRETLFQYFSELFCC